MPQVASTIAAVREYIAAAKEQAKARGVLNPRVACVPTMGALHSGHRALVAHAKNHADIVVVSLFVNPLQFGPGEDFHHYPRDPEADVLFSEQAGVDILFMPAVQEMYPGTAATSSPKTSVLAGPVGKLWEGHHRPGHFDGMLTVVCKLFNIINPDSAVFGEKDAQQVFLVQQMIKDFNLRVNLAVVETVREADGLALSSRNRYLSEPERAAATVIPRMLQRASAVSSQHSAPEILSAVNAIAASEPLANLEYSALVDPQTFLAVDGTHRGEARFLLALTIGTTRLIDTCILELG